MIMYSKILTGFARLGDNEFATLAQSIVEKMTDNANFPSPVPTLADVTTSIAEFRKALALSLGGSNVQTWNKNEKRSELTALLGELALYVHFTSKDDVGKLLSSGFDIRKSSSPVGVLRKPANIIVENGYNPGSIRLRVDRIPEATSYQFEYANAPVSDESHWTVRGVKVRTHIFEDLIRGQQYAFRVAGIGTDPTLVYSDVITCYVQ